MAGKVKIRDYDWWLIGAYLILIFFGWMNIYSSVCGGESPVFDFNEKYGMHLIWIFTSLILAISILFLIPSKTYSVLAYGFYLIILLALISVIFVGIEVNGSHSWFAIGPVRIQPAEFSKISTAFALSALLSKYGFTLSNRKSFLLALALLAVPMGFIVLEKETGSALVYLGFAIVLFLEGMSGWILVLGLYTVLIFILTLVFGAFDTMLVAIGLIAVTYALFGRNKPLILVVFGLIITAFSFIPKIIEIESIAALTSLPPYIWLAIIGAGASAITLFIAIRKRKKYLRNAILAFLMSLTIILSVDFLFHNVLKEYQQARIETLLGMRDDPMGVGYNVHQSLIAIGSGGLVGKGYLHGTQTRFEFVPEQSTDFIFCTVGEEWGFLGSMAVLAIYLFIIIHLFTSAERQRDKFNRIYGYCVACCIFMHVLINVGMTLGLMPVIGIPLPFLSYGGSSLWSFTILLFVYIKLEYDDKQ